MSPRSPSLDLREGCIERRYVDRRDARVESLGAVDAMSSGTAQSSATALVASDERIAERLATPSRAVAVAELVGSVVC